MIGDLEVLELGTNGRIGIPYEMREKLGLEKGDKILCIMKESTLVLKKITDADLKGIEKSIAE